MFCQACGKEVTSDTKYCTYCGNEINGGSPEKAATGTGPSDAGDKKIETSKPAVQRTFSSKINASTILGCIIGLFLFIGVFFPWVTVYLWERVKDMSRTKSGIEVGFYGILIIITGILCALLSFVAQKKNRALCFLILGVVSALDILVFVLNIVSATGFPSYIFDSAYVTITKDVGMWISLVGAIGALIFGISELLRNRNVT